jgi:transcriptional regulator with XRE-family HTH domain
MEPKIAAQDTSFGSWLKQRRISLDLTRKSLSECVGCSPKTIEKIESGERRPSRQIVQLLLGCLQVPEEQHEALLSRARLGHSQEGREPAYSFPEGSQPDTSKVPNNLPAPLTSFVGRTEALEATSKLLRSPAIRLVTLTGPPGIGKTRLSLQSATSLLRDFRDGVYFVPLAAVRDSGLVGSTIARELGVRESAGRTLVDAMKSYLRDKQLLLVLDNFEQVVEAAPLVTELLAATPNLKIIATSREALHLYGEHNYPVPPLAVP